MPKRPAMRSEAVHTSAEVVIAIDFIAPKDRTADCSVHATDEGDPLLLHPADALMSVRGSPPVSLCRDHFMHSMDDLFDFAEQHLAARDGN